MTQLLFDIFNHDFSEISGPEEFSKVFFAKKLTLADLFKVHSFMVNATMGGINSALRINGKDTSEKPFIILAQLHGNEPAGLAGILLAMALAEAGLLEKSVFGAIGNPLAGSQYFTAWKCYPKHRQETRDPFRCGLANDGSLLPDGNRIPIDFLARLPDTPTIKRPQELFALAQLSSGILDIHSARGNMVCITDHKHDNELKHSPIRAVLTGLAEAISVHASGAVTVQTLKTILHKLPNIKHQIGIEAGTHESPEAPGIAAEFTLAVLHNLGITKVPPLKTKDDGVFDNYQVQPRITFGDLLREGELVDDDQIVMGRVVDGVFQEHQYEEMEMIHKGQVVAKAEKSGTVFKAKFDFATLFISKSSKLYTMDPAVGPWPVTPKTLSTKFCYPCKVTPLKINFTK